MKKYILILLLCGIAKGQTNLFVRQNFATGNPTANTFIGGVSSTISTPALLATKLGISGSRITNFKVIGSDIQCRISGSYAIQASAFSFIGGACSYYEDKEGLVVSMDYWAFYSTYNFIGYDCIFKNLTTMSGDSNFRRVNANRFLLENLTYAGSYSFAESTISTVFYIPRCTNLGGTPLNNNFFVNINPLAKIYCHPSLATNNGGAPDEDLSYAITRGCTVRYVTNFDLPNPATSLSAGTITTTTIQLNFTTPTGSTNAIDYYEIWLNGVDSGKTVTASGQNVTGLTTATAYDIEFIAVDVFYNKSAKSNKITVSTL